MTAVPAYEAERGNMAPKFSLSPTADTPCLRATRPVTFFASDLVARRRPFVNMSPILVTTQGHTNVWPADAHPLANVKPCPCPRAKGRAPPMGETLHVVYSLNVLPDAYG